MLTARAQNWRVSVLKKQIFQRTWHLLVSSAGHELLSELQQRRFNGSEGGGGGGGGGGQAGEETECPHTFPHNLS